MQSGVQVSPDKPLDHSAESIVDDKRHITRVVQIEPYQCRRVERVRRVRRKGEDLSNLREGVFD